MNIAINKFKLKNIKYNGYCLIIGPRKCGKTTLAHHIIESRFQNEMSLFNSVASYIKCNEIELTSEQVSLDVIDKIDKINDSVKKYYSNDGRSKYFLTKTNVRFDSIFNSHKSLWNYIQNTKHPSVSLIEDCSLSYENLNTLGSFAMNGRCMRAGLIGLIESLQDLIMIVISNVDFIFLFRHDQKNRNTVYNQFLKGFLSFSDFTTIFMYITENYGCLVIDLKCKSENINDRLFWYRVDLQEQIAEN